MTTPSINVPPHNWFIAYGNFLFKRRNAVFPILLVPLFLSFTPNLATEWLPLLGLATALTGQLLRMAVIGFAYIKRGGLNKKVYAETLVTKGFFSLCRNPLYVGNVLILGGLLMIHGNPIVMLFGGIFFYTAYQAIIATEENYLHNKFGADYEAYCTRVPRWLLRLDRAGILRGMKFDWRKMVYKDYSTLGSWGSQAIVLFAYRAYSVEGHLPVGHGFALFGLVLLTLSVRLVKKRFPL